jgi:hypothetical protein
VEQRCLWAVQIQRLEGSLFVRGRWSMGVECGCVGSGGLRALSLRVGSGLEVRVRCSERASE